jgi:CubicO group peptidase (beta-lactamase class C family)
VPFGLTDVDGILERASTDEVVPGVVAIVADRDGVIYQGAAGVLGVGREERATVDTVFRIASMTKALTSVAALQLVERGKLALDQTVESVLPEFGDLQLLEGFDGDEPRLRPPSRKATIQHLLTHTSGLSYSFTNQDMLRWAEVTNAPDLFTGLRKSLDTPLVAEPGERWEYGISTAWLGLVVEAVSSQGLEAYMREHIFAPLAMRDATFRPTPEQRARMMSLHQRLSDGRLGPSKFDMPAEPEIAFGGEGAYATAGDYGRLLRALLRGGELDGARILEPETSNLMFTDHLAGAPLPESMKSAQPELTNDIPALPFEEGWGCGLHLVLEDVPGMRRDGTGDWGGLFNCYYWIDPTAGVTAAVFTQVLPFYDEAIVQQLLLPFEMSIYARLGA